MSYRLLWIFKGTAGSLNVSGVGFVKTADNKRDRAGWFEQYQIQPCSFIRYSLFAIREWRIIDYQTRACALHKVTASANLTTTANIDCPEEKPSNLSPLSVGAVSDRYGA